MNDRYRINYVLRGLAEHIYVQLLAKATYVYLGWTIVSG
jgi:hypothetical protein